MHSYQSPMAEDTPDVPPLSDITDKSVAPNTTDAPNCAPSHTYTASGKIRRVPSVIHLQPYEQDTTILPLPSSLDKVLPPRNYARTLYIPPMVLRSREPDEGEVLLGCCVLLMLSIVMSCGLYYFLIHIH